MHFYSLVRINNKTELVNQIELKNDTFLIFPLINPHSEVGQSISLNKNEAFTFLSQYSGDDVNIMYLAENKENEYSSFVKKIFDIIDDNEHSKIDEPCLLVFTPNQNKLYIFEIPDQDNLSEVLKLFNQIIDAARSKNPDMSFKFLKTKRRIDIKSVIKEAFKIIKDVVLEGLL